MKKYLQTCRRALANPADKDTRWCLVLSNSYWSFDAAMAVFSVAFYKQSTAANGTGLFIPIFIGPRNMLCTHGCILREFWKLDIDPDLLICSDEINPAWFDTFLLIGYHPSTLGLFIDERRIKWIFDYRPGFPAFRIAADCQLVCKNAGSVSTVVADYILRRSQASSMMTDDVKLALSLLYDGILFATHNLNTQWTWPLDRAIVKRLEGHLGVPAPKYGRKLIVDLTFARSETSNAMDSFQLLIKYFVRRIRNRRSTICLIWLPMSVLTFCARPDMRASLLDVGELLGHQVIVINTTYVDHEHKIRNDVAVFRTSENDRLYQKTLTTLEKALDMVPGGKFDQLEGAYFMPEPHVPLQRVDMILHYMK